MWSELLDHQSSFQWSYCTQKEKHLHLHTDFIINLSYITFSFPARRPNVQGSFVSDDDTYLIIYSADNIIRINKLHFQAERKI